MINLNIPYLRNAEIAFEADKVRNVNNFTSIPVNIEGLIENSFQVDIVPIPDMQRNLDLEGASSPDLTTIYVDDFVYKRNLFRYRFTIAHELGHMVLHPEYFVKLEFSSIVEWTKVINEINPDDYARMEYQAYAFAGQLLVPTRFLRTEFESELDLCGSQIEMAKKSGFGRDQYMNSVLDAIAFKLSPKFEVSTDVLSRRIKAEPLEQEIP